MKPPKLIVPTIADPIITTATTEIVLPLLKFQFGCTGKRHLFFCSLVKNEKKGPCHLRPTREGRVFERGPSRDAQ
jgi:hypothetical protein